MQTTMAPPMSMRTQQLAEFVQGLGGKQITIPDNCRWPSSSIKQAIPMSVVVYNIADTQAIFLTKQCSHGVSTFQVFDGYDLPLSLCTHCMSEYLHTHPRETSPTKRDVGLQTTLLPASPHPDPFLSSFPDPLFCYEDFDNCVS